MAHAESGVWNSGRPDLAQRESAWLVLPLRRYWSLAVPLSPPRPLSSSIRGVRPPRSPGVRPSLSLWRTRGRGGVPAKLPDQSTEVVHFSALRFRSTRCQRFPPPRPPCCRFHAAFSFSSALAVPVPPTFPFSVRSFRPRSPSRSILVPLSRLPPSARRLSCISLWRPARAADRSVLSPSDALSLPLSTPPATLARAVPSSRSLFLPFLRSFSASFSFFHSRRRPSSFPSPAAAAAAAFLSFASLSLFFHRPRIFHSVGSPSLSGDAGGVHAPIALLSLILRATSRDRGTRSQRRDVSNETRGSIDTRARVGSTGGTPAVLERSSVPSQRRLRANSRGLVRGFGFVTRGWFM